MVKDAMKKTIATIQKVWPIWEPGTAPRKAESGGYDVQPPAAAPAPTKNEVRIVTQPQRNVQKLRPLRKGKAMSRAPTWGGMSRLPNPLTGAVESTKNTMMVPCMVNSIA